MAGWSDLSPKLKRNVVEKLDFLSRHRLGITSRQNSITVYTTPIYVPRVRVSLKKAATMIMIHTAIDKWLRLELSEMPNDTTLVLRSENSWDPEKVVRKVMPGLHWHNAIKTLAGLLSYKYVTIGAMEWEVEGGTNCKEYEVLSITSRTYYTLAKPFVKNLQKFARREQCFRVKKLVFNWNSFAELEDLFKTICVSEDLVSTERLSLNAPKNSLTPVYCVDSTHVAEDGKYHTTSTISHYCGPEHDWVLPYLAATRDTGFATWRSAKLKEEPLSMWESADLPIFLLASGMFMRKQTIQFINAPIFLTHIKTKCGYWVYAVKKENEKAFDNFFKPWIANFTKNGICGLGWLCPHHTDPFDFHYHQNLGRRILHEPNWIDIITLDKNPMSEKLKNEIEEARQMYAKDEEEKSEEVSEDSEDSDELEDVSESSDESSSEDDDDDSENVTSDSEDSDSVDQLDSLRKILLPLFQKLEFAPETVEQNVVELPDDYDEDVEKIINLVPPGDVVKTKNSEDVKIPEDLV